MKVFIDASNLITGGGVSHIIGIIDNLDAERQGVEKIVVFSNSRTLSLLPEKELLIKKTHKWLNGNLFMRILWRVFKLDNEIRKNDCDALFIPSGIYRGHFHPNIVMPRNMLIYDEKERKRFGFSWQYFKHVVLEIVQTKSIKNSDGIIFISEYSKKFISEKIKIKDIPSKTIYHGVSTEFRKEPEKQKDIKEFNEKNPIKILYVSTVFPYKHQWIVVKAVNELKKEGFPVELHLVGGGEKKSIEKLNKLIELYDEKREFLKYHGNTEYKKIKDFYHSSDLFVYSSTCETMPNILIEAMSSGLPIACSNYEPMPEILKDGGIFFDPTSVKETKEAMSELINNPSKRENLAKTAFEISKEFNWIKCSEETFSFLTEFKKN